MSPLDGWADGIQQIHAEAGGMLSISLIDPARAHALLAASFAGDEAAARLMLGVFSAIETVQRAPRRKPVICLCCPRVVRPRDRFIVCVTMPENGSPSTGISSVLCARCFADKAGLNERVAAALRSIWPDARGGRPCASGARSGAVSAPGTGTGNGASRPQPPPHQDLWPEWLRAAWDGTRGWSAAHADRPLGGGRPIGSSHRPLRHAPASTRLTPRAGHRSGCLFPRRPRQSFLVSRRHRKADWALLEAA